MIDMQAQIDAIKASWVQRIVSAPENHKWSFLPKQYLNKFGSDFLVIKTTFNKASMFPPIKQIPEFYQQIVCAYNKSKIITPEDFISNIVDQPLWGNRFITFNNQTLFYSNWIESKIISLSNLRIKNGKIDINYIYSILKNKCNFFGEITILQNAIRAYNLDFNNEPKDNINIPIYVVNSNELFVWSKQKSKYYYTNLIKQKKERAISEIYWIMRSQDEISEVQFDKSYVNKVKLVKDKKLAETNFKILQNILPCNLNLFRWKKSDTKLCSLCRYEESVSHLIYECYYAKYIWNIVQQALNMTITHDMVIFGTDLSLSINTVLSLIAYIIYKDWLVCSLEKKCRKQFPCYTTLLNEIRFRKVIYCGCDKKKWGEICNLLDQIIDFCVLTKK